MALASPPCPVCENLGRGKDAAVDDKSPRSLGQHTEIVIERSISREDVKFFLTTASQSDSLFDKKLSDLVDLRYLPEPGDLKE
jgi:hypothetical protein